MPASLDGELRGPLRKAGYVTRDAREVERKKVGLHKHARQRSTPNDNFNPATRENCEGWVRLGFRSKQDIYKGELKIPDSKPPGKYDKQAIDALLKLLSTQIPMRNSKLKTTVDDSGQQRSVYTYTLECRNWEIVSQS